jgi:DNA-binding CsgD family transcriptional regulator
MSERPSHYAVSPRRALTPRQREVLRLIAKGHTNGEIAGELGISLDGAKFHVSEILVRLGVSTREEAASAWRAEQSVRGRLGAFIASFATAKFAALAAAVAVLAVVGGAGVMLLSRQSNAAPEVTVEDVIAATQKPGKALYLEMHAPPNGQDSVTFRMWYASDLDAARTETETNGAVEDVTLNLNGRRINYSASVNLVSDTPAPPQPPGVPDGALAMVTQVGVLLPPVTATFVGVEERNGQQVYRFDGVEVLTGDRAYERVEGTIQRYRMYLRTSDLLPVAVEATSQEPGKEVQPLPAPTILRAEFVDLATLPPDFFDAEALISKAESPDELLAVAAKQPFATYWLGPALQVPWTHPNGTTYAEQTLFDVHVPGVADGQTGLVSLGYGPGQGVGPALVTLNEGPLPAFVAIPSAQLHMMTTAGNVHTLPSGSGYTYLLYSPTGRCTPEQAQTQADCRQGRPIYGAVVELDGTRVHILASPVLNGPSFDDVNTNPFSSESAIADLAARLTRIP